MEIPRHWRRGKQRFLIGEVCPRCDAKIFPPRPIHQDCTGKQELIEVKNDDTIFSSRSLLYTSSSCMAEPQRQ